MKDIKFRIWDKDTNTMIYKGFVVADGRIGVLICSDEFDELDNAVAMQYTGLKDKNGKMVYEGDVLKSDGFQGVIEFKGGEFRFRYTCYDRYDRIWEMNYHAEVIGNIWENPELLK